MFGNFGLFYARMPNDLAARALSADDGISRADYFDASLTRPIPNGTVTQTSPAATPVTNHFVLAGVGADTIDPEREALVHPTSSCSASSAKSCRTPRRRALHLPQHRRACSRTSRTARWPPTTCGDAAACGSVEYILTNPSSATPINPALLAIAPQFGAVKFDDPVHKYDAVEFTLNRRMSNNWSMMASYRWSRLRGNFEGFYRDDNGQSDPGISSLYDFPTNDPTYTSIGVRQLGYRATSASSATPNGILPLDRPHQVKLFGNYLFPWGLNLGVGLNLSSGKPLTPMAAEPELRPTAARFPTRRAASGIQTVDGFKTRTPFQSQFDLQAAYNLKLGGRNRITLMADIFNLFNQQTILDYDNWTRPRSARRPNAELRPAARRACSPATRRSSRRRGRSVSASASSSNARRRSA